MKRAGFTLFEILLSLAILGAAMAALGQIASTGTDASREARDLAIARIICQTKLAEILLNPTITPTSISSAPVDSFDAQSLSIFTCSVEVQPAPMSGMLAIRVSVQSHSTDGGQALVTYSIDRWMIDPSLGLEQLEADEEAAKAAEEEVAA